MPNLVYYYLSISLNMIFFPLILLAGLVLCRKYKFMGGFYFFLLLLIHQIYDFLSPYIVRNLMNNRMDFQQGSYYFHLSYLFSTIGIFVQIFAFLILLVSLYKMFTTIDIAGQLLEKIKYKVINNKKITIILIAIFIFIVTVLLMIGNSKNFELISTKVQITNNPSTSIVSEAEEGEEPYLPDQYIEYTFVIKNKKNKNYGGIHNFIQLDFVPSKEIVLLFEEGEFNNRQRGYSGPGFFEANDTKEFKMVYGISDDVNLDIKSLEEQALNGQLFLSLNQKTIAKFSLNE